MTHPAAKLKPAHHNAFANALLAHYRSHGRNLPWRRTSSTYAIWLSEIMLQQTTVVTVIPYFERFLAAFPTVHALAAADEQAVLHLWQGLGYYSRARNLHKCAQVVVTKYAGQFPTSEAELLKLPGIGPYTAAAIAAIAFNRHATVVDGNVERVISRLYQVDTPLPDAKPVIKELAQQLTCAQHPGDYAGAIMDLGATVCTPKKPLCLTCPVRGFCACGNAEQAVQYPKKRAKAARPAKVGTAWAVFDPKGRVYLHQRPSKGLLANLWELPNNGWEKEDRLPPALAYWQRQANARPCGTIKHVFTHFSLQLQVLRLDLPATADDAPGLNQWFNLNALPPLPTLMKKVLSAAQQRD